MKLWSRMYPVLLYMEFNGFQDEFFYYNQDQIIQDDDILLFYYGCELSGDFLFMSTRYSHYINRTGICCDSSMDMRDVDTTKLTRMSPADAAKLFYLETTAMYVMKMSEAMATRIGVARNATTSCRTSRSTLLRTF